MNTVNSVYRKALVSFQMIYTTNIMIVMIILLSFFLHLTVLVELSENSPYFFNIQRKTDQDNYIAGAEGLLNSTWPANNPFFYSPYYSYYLAGTYLVHQDHFTPRFFQIFLGILLVVVTNKVASLIFSRQMGIASAFGVAVYGPLIFYNIEYNVVSHISLFIMSALYLTLIYRPHKSKLILFAIGFLLGMATIAQPQSIILALPSTLWVIRRHNQFQRKFITTLALLAGIAFVIAFPIIHNWKSTGQLSFITTTGALNLYIGNSPEAGGTFYNPNSAVINSIRDGKTTYFKEAIKFITQAPTDWLLLMVKKTAFMIIGSDTELGSNFNYHYWGELYSSTLQALSLRYELLILTVLTTIHLLIRNRKSWLLYLYVVFYYGATIIIFITARYRIPLTPILIILSIGALFEIYKRIRLGDYKVIILIIAILISYIAVMIRFNLWLQTHTFF